MEGLILRSNTQNYHHAHAFADAWAIAKVGEKLISTWGYGHSNLDIDLSKIDPDVVEVFGLDDPETNLSEPQSYLDRFQPQRDTTTAPGTRSRRRGLGPAATARWRPRR